MKRWIFLIAIISHGINLLAQYSVQFGGGVGYNSNDIFFSENQYESAFSSSLEAAIPLYLEGSLNFEFKEDWILSVGANYRHVSVKTTDSDLNDFSDFNYDYKIERAVLSHIIPNVTLEYRVLTTSRLNYQFGIGLHVGLPVGSYDEIITNDGRNDVYLKYRGTGNNGFKEGGLFGPRLQGGIVYGTTGRWSFGVMAIGEILFYGESMDNPKYVIGLIPRVWYYL